MPWAARQAARPRSDLPVATARHQPALRKLPSSSAMPSYSGSSSRPFFAPRAEAGAVEFRSPARACSSESSGARLRNRDRQAEADRTAHDLRIGRGQPGAGKSTFHRPADIGLPVDQRAVANRTRQGAWRSLARSLGFGPSCRRPLGLACRPGLGLFRRHRTVPRARRGVRVSLRACLKWRRAACFFFSPDFFAGFPRARGMHPTAPDQSPAPGHAHGRNGGSCVQSSMGLVTSSACRAEPSPRLGFGVSSVGASVDG